MNKVTSLLTNFFDSVGPKLFRGPVQKDGEAPGFFSVGYKNCQWCGDLVDPDECFAMYTGVSLICEICGKDVSKWEAS